MLLVCVSISSLQIKFMNYLTCMLASSYKISHIEVLRTPEYTWILITSHCITLQKGKMTTYDLASE